MTADRDAGGKKVKKKKKHRHRGSHDFCLFQKTSSGAEGRRDAIEGVGGGGEGGASGGVCRTLQCGEGSAPESRQ